MKWQVKEKTLGRCPKPCPRRMADGLFVTDHQTIGYGCRGCKGSPAAPPMNEQKTLALDIQGDRAEQYTLNGIAKIWAAFKLAIYNFFITSENTLNVTQKYDILL